MPSYLPTTRSLRREIGHVPPHLPLVNRALATITFNQETREITQELR